MCDTDGWNLKSVIFFEAAETHYVHNTAEEAPGALSPMTDGVKDGSLLHPFLVPLFPNSRSSGVKLMVFACVSPLKRVFSNGLRFRERNCLLKEAKVLHKARFNHIIQILGICNEPEFFCIVTEYMSNGSLDLLLHQVATCATWRGASSDFPTVLILMLRSTTQS